MCYWERREPRISFEYKFVGHPLKTSKIIPNRTCISVFLHTVLYCFHWVHRQVEGVRSAHGGSLRYEAIGQIQNFYVILKGENLGFPTKLICYCERGEPRLSFEYKFVSHPWKLLKLYPTVHAYLFFFTLYCMVSTQYTGKLKECEVHTEPLKVWRNMQNSKCMCYCERREPRLSFEYKFVGHPWKLLKSYPTVRAYLCFFTLYCTVSTENNSKLKECHLHTDAL